MGIDLVIFDCDGVLVDSEMLSAGVLMGMMAEEGYPLTEEAFRADFLGRSFAAAALRAKERFGRALPEDFESRYRDRLFAALDAELKPMAGVAEVLGELRIPFSGNPTRTATGSTMRRAPAGFTTLPATPRTRSPRSWACRARPRSASCRSR